MRDDPDRAVGQAPVAHRWHYAVPMRSLGLSVCLALGSVACTETGAHLTFSAPEGPASAASYRVVLASPENIAAIDDQRIEVGDNAAVHTVSYFLQRTTAGATGDKLDRVDGLTVRVAPDGSVADTQFIPFVLLYDAGDKIVGVGTYLAGDTPAPSPILVMRDEIDKYTLDVESVAEVSDMDSPAPGQVQVISCTREDSATFTSGIVWRPRAGGELRIVLPEHGDDATGRELDLDCDGHVVTAESSRPDCDDTRDWFHRDAEDVCDGYDTNCDGLQTIATVCTSDNVCLDPVTQLRTGIELCDDEAGTSLGCRSGATCNCTAGSGQCTKCIVPYVGGSAADVVKPCQPAVGILQTYGKCSELAPCTVEIVAVRNGWKVEIGATASDAFGNRAVGITDSFAIKAKRPEGGSYEVQGDANMALADVDFAFVGATSTYYFPVQLALAEGPLQGPDCPAAVMMTCHP